MKDILARLWTDRCTVTTREPYRKENGATAFREVDVMQDIPCKLSFYNSQATGNPASIHGPAAPVNQLIKLFLAPGLSIPPGSRITVKRGAHSAAYKASSAPSVFHNHQEIMLELFDEWA